MKDTTLMALELGLIKRKQFTESKLKELKEKDNNGKIAEIQKRLMEAHNHMVESPRCQGHRKVAAELLKVKISKQKFEFLSQKAVINFIMTNRGSKGNDTYIEGFENPLNFFQNMNVNQIEREYETLLRLNHAKSFSERIKKLMGELEEAEIHYKQCEDGIALIGSELEKARNEPAVTPQDDLWAKYLQHEIDGINIQLEAIQEFQKKANEGEPDVEPLLFSGMQIRTASVQIINPDNIQKPKI